MKPTHLILSLSVLLFGSCSTKPQADLLLYNAVVYTVDDAFSVHDAIAVSDGKVVAVGAKADLEQSFAMDSTLDLNGAIVFPGFIDAHCHVMGYAQALLTADLRAAGSEKEMVLLLKRWYDLQVERGLTLDRVQGWGWDQNNWPGKEMPERSLLDSLFPDVPVILRRVDGHAVLVNGKALETDEVCCPDRLEGGEIVMDGDRPTGLLIDNAVERVEDWTPDKAQRKDALKLAEQNLLAHGLTGLHDAGLPKEEWMLLRSMSANGDFRIPISCMASDDPENFAFLRESGPIEEDRFWLRSVKFYSDGALGSRGALLLEPYADAPHAHGLPVTSREDMKERLEEVYEMGLQACVHAIGDSANRMVLKLYADRLQDDRSRRWRVEHAQVVQPDDRHWFSDHGIIPSVQPTHATSDADWAEDRLGAGRMEAAYAYSSLRAQLGILPLGTDFPVEDIDPLKTFYSAVSRKDFSGMPESGFLTSESLSREEAIRGMTVEAAYAQFRETETGSLEAGKWADLVVLDTDLMKCAEVAIPTARILSTWIRGERLYSAQDSN